MNIVATSKAPRFIAVTAVVLFTILTVLSITVSAEIATDDSALINNTAVRNDSDQEITITSTVAISDSTQITTPLVTANAVVVSSTYTYYFPIAAVAFEQPNLSTTDSKKDGDTYAWLLSWSQTPAAVGEEYIIEESHSADFSTVTSYTTTATSYKITHAAGLNPVYYYRVRLNDSRAPYSNNVTVTGAYYIDFSSSLSSWQLVKEDFDDTQNVLSRTGDGNMKMHVQGRWDFMITSPLVPAPEPPYRISTRIKFDGPGNLNTYGAIIGADWNGWPCPEYVVTGKYVVSNCFNNYYRNILLWNWGGNTMQSSVKQITQHTADKNAGRGDTFFDYTTINISSGSANDWNEWSWEVHPSGTINILAGDIVRQSFHSEAYINNRYWGFWASTDEYPGSDPLFDWILVEPIDVYGQP